MRTSLALAYVLAAALSPAASLAAGWEFSSAVNYDTGKYGSKYRTESVYVPFTFKRYFSDADLTVTVPYLRQSSRGRITRIGGNPVPLAGNAAAANSPEAGLGDILVRGAYTLKLDGPKSFDLGLAGRLKLPTASSSKGLGTGELDESVGLEFAKEVAPGWTLLADGYYTIVGEPEGTDLNNEAMFDVGFYRPLRKNLGLTVLYEARSAIVDGNAAPRSVSAALSCGSGAGIQFAGGVTLGLSEGSPALAVGAGLNRKF